MGFESFTSDAERLYRQTHEVCGETLIERLGSIEGLYEEKWSEFSPVERLDTLRELERCLAEAQGREPRTIVAQTCQNNGQGVILGYYDHTRPLEININEVLLERPELRTQAIHTLAHEGRHAFQHDVVVGKVFYNPEVSVYWRANWDNYLSAQKFGFEIYRSQPLELDANSYADRILNDMGLSKR